MDAMTDLVPPLGGFTVAVTASRRAEELGSLLERRGARVVYAPAIRIIPLEDDTELLAATRAVHRVAARHRDRDHRHRFPRLG